MRLLSYFLIATTYISAFLSIFSNGFMEWVCAYHWLTRARSSLFKRLSLWRLSDGLQRVNQRKWIPVDWGEKKEENVVQYSIGWHGDIIFKSAIRASQACSPSDPKFHSTRFFHVIVAVTQSSGKSNAEACRFETLPMFPLLPSVACRVPHYACLPDRCFAARKRLSDFAETLKARP